MINIVVGSQNPIKINASKAAISALYPDTKIICLGVPAPSNVSEQPMTEAETRSGTINRVNYCIKHHQADFYVAIEGGVDVFQNIPATFAYVVIADNNKKSVGRSANLPLPNRIYQALQQGEELGDVMDRFFNTTNIKQQGGAMSLLTKDHATREGVYIQALLLALAPFFHTDLYAQ